MSELAGKTLIVTGASGGIGKALALELAGSGVNLVLNARHSGPLHDVASECEDLGVKVAFVAGSAAEREIAWELVHTALDLGSFHGFIQVAGVLCPGPFLWELSNHDFREVFDASVVASYQLIKFSVPELRRRGGGLAVFFGSGAAVKNTSGLGAYSAAKAAEEHLARQLAVEVPEITAFAYRPGVVDTPMVGEAFEAEGGAGEELRRYFMAYRDKGEIIPPEVAARSLVNILNGDPHRFHGGVATWRDGAGEE